MFRKEGAWQVWSGVHMPLRHDSPRERDIKYEWRGGNFDIVLADEERLSYGEQAEFSERPDGGFDVTNLPMADCTVCPPGEGREILSEQLGLDAARMDGGYPAVEPDMQFVAGATARTWPFRDPVLRAAAGMALQELAHQRQPIELTP